MKIARESATELVFRKGINLITILFSLFMGYFAVLSLLTLILENRIITVQCLRSEERIPSDSSEVVPANCTVQTSVFFGLLRQPPKIVNQVIQANLVTDQIPANNSDCSTIISHSLVLTPYTGKQVQIMGDEMYSSCVTGNAPLFDHYATRLNQFIASDQQAIKFSQDNRFTFYGLIGGGFLCLFVAMGQFIFREGTRIETLIFDKRNGTIIRKERELLILLKESRYQFSDVKTVEARVIEDLEGVKQYEAFFVMQSGIKIGFGGSGNEDEVRAVADTLRQTLSRP